MFLVLFCSRCQAQQYHCYNMHIVCVNLLLQSLLHRHHCLELIIIFMIIIFVTVNQYHVSNILCMLIFYFSLSFIDIVVWNLSSLSSSLSLASSSTAIFIIIIINIISCSMCQVGITVVHLMGMVQRLGGTCH